MTRTATSTFHCWRQALGLLLLLLVATSAVRAQAGSDWPQWRGADGMAASSETDLPADLGAENLVWKVPLRGEGHSSPIVSDGRVFVTTAYPGTVGEQFRKAKIVALCVLGALVLLILAFQLRGRFVDPGVERPGGLLRAMLGLETLGVALGSVGFVLLAIAAGFVPERFWPPGQPGEAWCVTGAIGLTGLALAFGWLRPSSSLRLLGAIVLLGCAAALWIWIPFNRYTEPFNVKYRAVMVAPGNALAAWYVLMWIMTRGKALPRPRLNSGIAALALIAMPVLLFVGANFLEPKAGLVRAVLCHDLRSGEQLWDTGLFVAEEERKYKDNSYATPTPCTDGERVFAHFGPGYACLDRDGNVLWSVLDETYTPNTRYGASSSPVLLDGDFLLLQDNELDKRDSFIMRLDPVTGEARWRVESRVHHDSYTTPLIVPRGDGKEIVAVTFELLVSYDPETGERLWQLPMPIKQMVPSLCYAGDDLLLVSGGTHLKFSTSGIKLNGTGKDTVPEVVWSTRRAVPGIPSPVLHGGCFFTVNESGIMTCFDPRTGDTHWKERLGMNVKSSLVAADGKVWAIGDEGRVMAIAAGPKYEVLAEAELGESCSATPAIAEGCIVVRGFDHLLCFKSGGAR